MERYSNNRIYLSNEEQTKIKDTRILLAGAGINSVIAECALRFGFETITIVDGEKVRIEDLTDRTTPMLIRVNIRQSACAKDC